MREHSDENDECQSGSAESDLARIHASKLRRALPAKSRALAILHRSTYPGGISAMAKNARRKSASTTLFDRVGGSPTIFVVMAVVVLAVYGQTLSFTLGKFDEDVIIKFNEKILKNPSNALDVLGRDAFFNNPGRNFYRPVQNFSFFLDTQVGNGRDLPYYLSNLLIHIATCWLLFLTLRDLRFTPGTSAASSLIFAVSPLFVHAVAWIPGRGDLLIGMFALLCLRLALRYLESGRGTLLAAFHAIFFLSMFSKETSVLIPVVVAGAWWLIYPDRSATTKRLSLLLLPCVVPIVLFFILRRIIIPKFPAEAVFGITPFLNNLRVIPESIGKFFVPIGLAPLPEFSWLVTGIGTVVAAMLIFFALRGAEPMQRKLTAFGIGWYLLFTIPGAAYTNELGSIAYEYLEHRSYLPMMGIVLVFGVVLSNQFARTRRDNVAHTIVGFIALLGVVSILHARSYKTAESFYNMAIDGNPNSGMALLNRGYLKASKGDVSGAMEDYTRATVACPTYAEAFVNRGVLYQDMGRMTDAGRDFRQAVALNPKLFAAQYNMANWYGRTDDIPNALKHYDESTRLRPTFAEGWAMSASMRAKMGDLQAALPYFDSALAHDPSLHVVFTNRGKAYYNAGRRAEACQDWQHGAAIGDAECAELMRTLCR
ncbi:MAG: tetratricopeptide repeat protein [Candidatus Kapabacteria bacterium]|nr:tetratricopeptide repeat protein [Candidatus Kapabacteria bacterium]